VRRHRRWLATLSRADAFTYCTAVEESAVLQLLNVWPPGMVVTDGVVVHQKDVLSHFTPNTAAYPIEALLFGAASEFNAFFAIPVPASIERLGKCSTEPFSTCRAKFLLGSVFDNDANRVMTIKR
jgi:hypothetical protein